MMAIQVYILNVISTCMCVIMRSDYFYGLTIHNVERLQDPVHHTKNTFIYVLSHLVSLSKNLYLSLESKFSYFSYLLQLQRIDGCKIWHSHSYSFLKFALDLSTSGLVIV